MQINVIKRDGKKEVLDLEKLHLVVQESCDGITGVSASEVELKSQLQFYNNIKTSDIQETLIKAAADLISEDAPNYQWVAGRLVSYHLRKQVYGRYEPDHLLDHYNSVLKAGYYDPYLKQKYTEEEFDQLNSFIDHNRDGLLAYAGIEQFRGKYLVKDRTTGKIYETPQMAFILIAATLFANYDKKIRMQYVKDYYDAISTFDISLPTPVMAGLRTPQRQFSSCVLIECDDSLDSINATTSSIVKYVSQKAGIGIGAGRIRAIGSPVRKGDTAHTGVIPFYKLFQAAVSSCSQGGVRSGAATLNCVLWHYEIEDILVLKNNKGTENNRVRHLDYCIQFNKLMYERLLQNGNITLFSPADVPDLYNVYFTDAEKFKELYEKAESNPKLRKKQVKALDLFSSFLQERKDTGRIYLMNVDHANDHSSFRKDLAPVRMTNLCTEITLPTVPFKDHNDPEAMVALCTLSAVNWGKIKSPADFEKPCDLAVRGLDALLDFQSYPLEAARKATMKYRPLGVGIINFAYWLAKNDMSYSDPDLAKVDEYTEAWAYYLTKASVNLAKEMGACSEVKNTKYHQGLFPKDTYKKEVDELTPHKERMPWGELKKEMLKHGIRNSTLMALMPSETSSQVSNSTNGIEPARALIATKTSNDGVLKQVVPEFRRLKNKYELLWDQPSPEGYLKICAVIQKYVDQAISVNTSYNPKFYPDEKIPLSELIKHIIMHYRYGGKTLYYFNTNDGAGEIEQQDLPKGDDTVEEDCDSCKI